MDLGSRTDLPGISAVLPAYNEAAAIGTTVEELQAVLTGLGMPFEIIVVDDGSVDRTGAIADRLAAQHPAIRVVHHPRNRGYGAALTTGFAAARRAWVFLMDADGQFDPRELPGFLSAAADADFVVGYRTVRADPGHRALFARIWAGVMTLALGIRVRDVDCAFKLMRRSFVAAMPLEARGAFLSAELLAKAGRLGARIVERPVRHLPRRAGRSTGGTLPVLLRAFYEFARLWLRIRRFSATGAAVEAPPPRLS